MLVSSKYPPPVSAAIFASPGSGLSCGPAEPRGTARRRPTADAANAAAAAAVPAHRDAAAATAAKRRAVVHAGEANRIHHHVFFLGAFHHVFQRAAVRTWIEWSIDAVSEHEDHPAALLVKERRDADVDGIP